MPAVVATAGWDGFLEDVEGYPSPICSCNGIGMSCQTMEAGFLVVDNPSSTTGPDWENEVSG